MKKIQIIIFTDLDGTLLDKNYSYKAALPALKVIRTKKVPLVLCSSKTKKEIEHIRKKMNNGHPFVAENGGGIFIPRRYFKLRIMNYKLQTERDDDYLVIKLGASYRDLRDALSELREKGFKIRGFGDMSITEISELTGLRHSDAKRAKMRDFDEPFIVAGKSVDIAKLKRSISVKGFHYTQGEFFHIMGDSDKGRAVDIIKGLYKKQYGRIISVALGDSPNDIEMLQRVDYPVVVQKKDGSYNREVVRKVRGCVKADGRGPDGWNRAVLKLLETVGL